MDVFDQKLLYLGKVVVLGQNGCIRAKVDEIGQGGCYPAKWLYSCKIGCNRVKVVLFRQKWLYSGKSGCIWAKVVVFR